MHSEREARRESFGHVAHVYAQNRPEYPRESVQWLVGSVGSDAATVLELGAGTGKLTRALLEEGHRVIATEPAPAMLAKLAAQFEEDELGTRLACVQAAAEAIPFTDSRVDVVVAAQAFHWFDPTRALAEIARILRPGGAIGLIWNFRDESVPWVRRLSEVVGSQNLAEDPTPVLEESGLFDQVKSERFRMWQRIDRDGLVGLVESRSYVASRPRHVRQEILARVKELYDEAARSPEGLILPYTTICYRAQINALSRRRVDAESLFWT